MYKNFPDSDISKLHELLVGSNNILIISHINPDGDAIGSVKAMKYYLSSKGVKSSIAIPNNYPEYLLFMDKEEEIMVWKDAPCLVEHAIKESDLILSLDFNQFNRVDDMEICVRNSEAVKVLIDHHPVPESESFDLVFSDCELSSTCEVLYWLIYSMEGYPVPDAKRPYLPMEVASSLYVGLMTDTNNFSNSVVYSTFEMASDLLAHGVDKEKLQHFVFGGFSENRMRLMGHLLLNRMVLLPKYGAGYILLSREEQENFGYTDGDSEGFVNMPLNIKGINISALFTENGNNIRVSLRSVTDFSVNRLARDFFNGGGHERAAGGKLFITMEEVPEYFEKSLKNSFEEANSDEN